MENRSMSYDSSNPKLKVKHDSWLGLIVMVGINAAVGLEQLEYTR